MKNILFVIGQMRNGGAERVTALLAGKLIEYNYRVGIIIYRSSETEYALHPKIEQFRLPNKNSNHQGNVVSRRIDRMRYIRKTIRNFQPDCIIPILDVMAEELLLPNMGYHIPIIVTVRDKPVNLGLLHNILRRIAFRKSRAVFLQTESQKQFFGSQLLKKAFVVPNPVSDHMIELGNSYKYRERIVDIVSFGRLDTKKNQKLLIRAVFQVHKIYPNIRLRIGGLGKEYDSLKNIIFQLNAQTYIQLIGWVNDISQILLGADLFILSSDYEGFPNALLEAMALGIPCISTDCPTGPAELLGNNERGILVPVGDVCQMANAIIYLMEHHNKAVQYGIAARQYVEEELTEDRIIKKFIASLEKYITTN